MKRTDLEQARFVLRAGRISLFPDFSRRNCADRRRAAGQDYGIPWAIRRDGQGWKRSGRQGQE